VTKNLLRNPDLTHTFLDCSTPVLLPKAQKKTKTKQKQKQNKTKQKKQNKLLRGWIMLHNTRL
jgi:hypothetical protein